MDTGNKVLLEEMMRDAEKADEPGELVLNQLVEKGITDKPQVVDTQMESAGYVYIYDRKTGARSLCNRNMLARKLQLKKDGAYVFTTNKPNVTPKVGTYKCLLHKDAPDRQHFDDLGFAYCPKDNLLSPFHVRRHMQKRHKVEWGAIEEEKATKEKEEDRAFQRMLIGKASTEEKPPLYVSKKDMEK